MTRQRWQALMTRLGLSQNVDVHNSLAAAYAETHRHYHTAAHIDHCLELLDEFQDEADNPEEIELALWFHDAVYNPMSKDNEAKSADWAERFLMENDGDQERSRKIRAMIMATVHDAPVSDPDTRLLVDIDLSILGADPARYAEFEREVRREYRWVPGPMFRKGRQSILESFLERDTIYSTGGIRHRYEEQARENLAAAVSNLRFG